MLMKQVHAKILVAIFILSALIGAQLATPGQKVSRSEEHTSELQSRLHLVCRLLLEKKKVYHHPSTFGHLPRTKLLYSCVYPNPVRRMVFEGSTESDRSLRSYDVRGTD